METERNGPNQTSSANPQEILFHFPLWPGHGQGGVLLGIQRDPLFAISRNVWKAVSVDGLSVCWSPLAPYPSYLSKGLSKYLPIASSDKVLPRLQQRKPKALLDKNIMVLLISFKIQIIERLASFLLPRPRSRAKDRV